MAFASSVVAPLHPPPRPPSGAAWERRARATPPRLVLVASSRGGDPAPPTFERLREQLLQLHAEADLTQSKANSARVRLVRLTEAAENLKKRAVVSVRLGRENEAVDLLVQKKKLTKALENIKERIEVLDKLSAKISEAISMKQNMLIEHALRPGMPNGGESNGEIRVFSGKVDDGAGEASCSLAKSGEGGSFEMKNVVYSNMTSHSEQSELQLADSFTLSKDHDPTNSTNNRSAYGDFIERIDSQLSSLEYEIEQFVSSQLAQEGDIQQQRNGKWHKLTDIMKLLTETRKRIANILDDTGTSLIDVNIEGEERTRWKVGEDTLLVFSLVDGGRLEVLELALLLLFGRKEGAHLFGTSQDFLLSCLEEYLWSRWTKGSRGSSMEDIFEPGLIILQLAVLRTPCCNWDGNMSIS